MYVDDEGMVPAAPGTTTGWEEKPVVAWRGDGRPVVASKDVVESTIIPAAPGWMAISTTDAHDDDFWVWQSQVIAWRISVTHLEVKGGGSWSTSVDTVPIVANGESLKIVALLAPDGRVYETDGQDFASVEEWEKYARGQWDLERDRIVAKKELARAVGA